MKPIEHHTVKKDEFFSSVRDTLISNLPTSLWTAVQNPSMKTIRDKFRSMQPERRETNRKNMNSSGIAEEVGAVKQLLDDFLLEMD